MAQYLVASGYRAMSVAHRQAVFTGLSGGISAGFTAGIHLWDMGAKRIGGVNIAGWQDTPVARLMRERTGLPVRLGNDGNVAAMAEFWKGAGRGKKVVVVLTIGTGVGSGVVIDGRILDGAA